MRLLFLAAVMFGLAACSAPSGKATKYPVAQKDYSFAVKIEDFIGAVGVGATYYLSGDAIVVTVFNDFGKPTREILNRALTEEEKQRVKVTLESFDVESFQDEYINPNIYDGTEMWFEFRIAGRPEKKITLKNVYVKELFDLASLINGLVPEGMPKMLGGRPAASHG